MAAVPVAEELEHLAGEGLRVVAIHERVEREAKNDGADESLAEMVSRGGGQEISSSATSRVSFVSSAVVSGLGAASSGAAAASVLGWTSLSET
jgi:hypothetical protein